MKNGIPVTPSVPINDGKVSVPGTVNVLTLGDASVVMYPILEPGARKERRSGLCRVGRLHRHAHRRTIGTVNLNAGLVGGGTASSRSIRNLAASPQPNLQNGISPLSLRFLANSRRRFRWHLSTSYTWSKGIGLANLGGDNDGGLAINEPNFRNLNRSVLGINIPHNLQFSGSWELPFGKGKRWLSDNAVTSALTGGWQLSWLYGAFSGTPFSVTSSGTSLNAPGSTQRADLVKSEVQKLGGIGVGTPYYDPTAFAPVTTVRFGTAAFNLLQSPGTSNLDLGLFREFRITEGIKLQFRAEAFNATNTPHFAAPGGNASAPSRDAAGNILTDPVTGLPRLNGFMEVTNTRSFGREGIDERVFRFGLRLSF
ncbi:MAG: hypothetical protein U0X75_16565 [Acidobacteriota bacterium]